jgi:hypothetical protein
MEIKSYNLIEFWIGSKLKVYTYILTKAKIIRVAHLDHVIIHLVYW